MMGRHIPLILLAPFFPDYGLWAAVAVGSGLKPMVPKMRNEESGKYRLE